MILIVGNNHDDILYYETRLTDKKEEMVFNKYKVVTGTISNQSIVLVDNIYTNIISSAIVSYLIEKYYILFVIKIGKCYTLSKEFKVGDVVLSKKVVASDVNVSDIQGNKLGQIPGLSTCFYSNTDLQNMITSSFTKTSFVQPNLCTVISSNTHYTNAEQLKFYINEDKIFNEDINNVIFDSELYGIGVACELHDIPFISLNVVVSRFEEKFSTTNYIKVLKQYGNVGKAICNTISELGSREVLR